MAVRSFEAAARRLSFSLAAHELHVTQSAVSRQIRLLEEFLGYRLFERLTRSVALTPEGAVFFQACEKSLDILEAATRGSGARGEKCTLKISITPSLAFEYLLPRLPSFSDVRPDIEVRVLTSTAPADFRRDDIDAAIRLGPLPGKRYLSHQPRIPHELVKSWSGVTAFQLWDEVLTPVISRRMLEAGSALGSPLDLCQFTLLSLAPRPTAWADWFRTRGMVLPLDIQTKDFGHFFMTLEAARAGRGVALVPNLFLHKLVDGGDLFCPFESSVSSAGEYYFLCRDDAAMDGPMEALLQWLQKDAANPAR